MAFVLLAREMPLVFGFLPSVSGQTGPGEWLNSCTSMKTTRSYSYGQFYGRQTPPGRPLGIESTVFAVLHSIGHQSQKKKKKNMKKSGRNVCRHPRTLLNSPRLGHAGGESSLVWYVTGLSRRRSGLDMVLDSPSE